MSEQIGESKECLSNGAEKERIEDEQEVDRIKKMLQNPEEYGMIEDRDGAQRLLASLTPSSSTFCNGKKQL